MTEHRHDHGDSWDEQDFNAAVEAYHNGVAVKDIAYMLGRSTKAVMSKFYRHAIKRSA